METANRRLQGGGQSGRAAGGLGPGRWQVPERRSADSRGGRGLRGRGAGNPRTARARHAGCQGPARGGEAKQQTKAADKKEGGLLEK